jgi:hypothetical protein
MKTIKAKPVITLCLFICIYALSNAQNGPPPPPPNYGQPDKDAGAALPSGYISVNFGFANPEGGYSSAVGSGYGGYALPGDMFNLSMGFPINRSNFGVAFMFGSTNNQYDLNTYANNNNDYAIYPDQNYYSETSLMGGLYMTFPLGRYLSFDGRFMLGALLSNLPEQDYGYNDDLGNSYQFDLQSTNSASLAFDAGVGVRCMIAHFWRRKLCAMLNVDYLASSVPYTAQQNLYEIPATGPNAGYQVQLEPGNEFSGHIPVNLLNITFGLGYQL